MPETTRRSEGSAGLDAFSGDQPLHVVTIGSIEQAAIYRQAWLNLLTVASEGEWFCSPLWLEPLLNRYFSDAPAALQFIFADDELMAVVPLLAGGSIRDKHLASVHLPVNSHVRRIGILSRIPARMALRASFTNLRATGLLRCVGLPQITQGSALEQAIHDVSQDFRHSLHRLEEQASAIIDLPEGWSAYAKTRTGAQLHPLRRERKLQRDGGMAIRVARTPEEIEVSWDALLEIERHSWKHEEGTSIANETGAHAFYKAVATRAASSDMLRLHILEHRGMPIAHTFGIISRGTYYLLKHSYHAAFQQYSPGFLLIWRALEASAGEGCVRMDLLGDTMDWKLNLATSTPQYSSYYSFPRSNWRCQSWKAGDVWLKPMARRLGIKRLMRLARGQAR